MILDVLFLTVNLVHGNYRNKKLAKYLNEYVKIDSMVVLPAAWTYEIPRIDLPR